MAKTPTISIIERRLQGSNVFRTSGQPIALVEPQRWTVRWINSKLSPDRLFDVVHNRGWAYVEPADLACPVEEIGATARDGRIVRGERGDEILVKMPTRDYRRLERKKTDQTLLQTFGTKHLADRIVSDVATAHGDQAADWVAGAVRGITVQDARGPETE